MHLLSPNTLMAEANLHASCHHPEGTNDFYMEVVHYFFLRVEADFSLQIARLMVVLYQLPVTDEQLVLIHDHVSKED